MSKQSHAPEVIDCKFNRQRADTDTLRKNCSAGYIFTHTRTKTVKKGKNEGKQYNHTGASGQAEYHHVLPIETLQDASIRPSKKLDFFHDCMAITTWDINDEPNLISLPTKAPHYAADKRKTEADFPILGALAGARGIAEAAESVFGALPDLPCHKHEHNPHYNRGVRDWLVSNIWKPLAKEQKDCNIDPKDIAGELDNASAKWRMWLKERGQMNTGAANCWRRRHEPAYQSIWYIPFSMHPGAPTPCKPPPDVNRQPKKVKKYLEDIFSHLV